MTRASDKLSEIRSLIQAAYPLVKCLEASDGKGNKVLVNHKNTYINGRSNGRSAWKNEDNLTVLRVLKKKIPEFESKVAQALYLTVMEIPEVSALYMSGHELLASRWHDAKSAVHNSKLLLNKLVFNSTGSEVEDEGNDAQVFATLTYVNVSLSLRSPTSTETLDIATVSARLDGSYHVSSGYTLLAIVNLNTVREAVRRVREFERSLLKINLVKDV